MLPPPLVTKCPCAFWKNAPRPRWEAWFWKRHKSKIMKHMPLGPSNYACMHIFLHNLLQPEMCKIYWKTVYFFFMAPFGKPYLALSALSYALNAKITHFRIAFDAILWKIGCRLRWEAWFWKRHKSKIMKHMPRMPSNYACMQLFARLLAT